jgi:RHS repeat-associated protein
MFYRARWYDPYVGRFISEDPIGFRGRDVTETRVACSDVIQLLVRFSAPEAVAWSAS